MVNFDRVPSPDSRAHFIRTDLTDFSGIPDQDAVTQRLCARAAGRRRVSHLNAGPHASWLGLAIHEQDGAP